MRSPIASCFSKTMRFTTPAGGSVLNALGIVDCDASIMDGRTLDAGAIAGVRGIRNPVLLARAVLEKSEHVFLIGKARRHSLGNTSSHLKRPIIF